MLGTGEATRTGRSAEHAEPPRKPVYLSSHI